MRIAISTGGGDAPGLNAVIRAAVLAAVHRGWECFGVKRGFGSLLGESDLIPLGPHEVRGITHLGGTILGTSSRGDPLKWRVQRPDGSWEERDRSQELLDSFHAHRLDALIAIGGEGTLGIVHSLWKKGLPVVGVPKTIDNDVGGTSSTFGFDTAVATATDAIDKVHSTAESHERVIVVEVMGRHAGFIALNAGVAGSADVILIPEIPFDIDKVCDKIRRREAEGRHFSVVVVAEGALPKGGTVSLIDPEHERLGGIADKVAHSIQGMTGKETRSLVLGHLQRGGSPTTFDRLLALRFGAAAIRIVAERQFGMMVAFQPPGIVAIPLEQAIAQPRRVPLDSDTITTARDLGISFGD
ncbi:MAG: 6-phosphofructokinase [Gemmatimonadetes bacterium 13_2_20CM_2_65_7]|nr:MAG: 6-phosphofructokinase [Gemmatimonadetes bacterium 13_2_20CM_2_65_7]OLC38258.1 MAG: 6-phosphofructokinase [Gemmatimonadetes bacterium 13_1_40CM_4_65_7]OLC99447.1 MAG: 6-phosphofructokinase [Gemmatimonadetes bacterium 13_1_40CM_3_65_8]